MDNNKDQTLVGAGAALAAFSLWGIFPIYFKAVSHIPAFEVLAHRIVWTVVFVGLIIILKGSLNNVRAAFHNKKLLATLLLSSLLVSTNWLVFIWAVAHDRVLETSLGYFINPLVNVALGMFFLNEKLRTWQWIAVGLSVLGVGNLVWQHGAIPWVALTVSISFGFYGLVRKIAVIDAFSGLFVETILIVPPILAYLVFIGLEGTGVFDPSDIKLTGLLMMAGLMTATPLVLFTIAVKKLTLSTVGFFQYITPTGHFLLAVFLYNEPFTDAYKITFGMIWLALAIYLFESIAAHRRK
jgi:chloramphenicol-sensitive protein RarD